MFASRFPFTLSLKYSQGDQIGLIFAHMVIVYFGQLFESYRSSAHCWATPLHGSGYALILTKNGLGYISGN
jgi:hypothetical protein